MASRPLPPASLQERVHSCGLSYPPPQSRASTLAWVERHPLTGENLVYGTHLNRNSGGGGPGAVHRTQNGLVNLWGIADVRQGLDLALFPRVLRNLQKPR